MPQMPARLDREPERRQPDRNEHRQQEVAVHDGVHRAGRDVHPSAHDADADHVESERRVSMSREIVVARDHPQEQKSRAGDDCGQTEQPRDPAMSPRSDRAWRAFAAKQLRQPLRHERPRAPGHLRRSQRQAIAQAVDLRAVGPHHLLAASPGSQRIRERPKLMNSSSDGDERHGDDEPPLPGGGKQHRASPDLPGEEHGHDRQREFANQKADREHDAEPDRSSSKRPGDQHEEQRQDVAAAGPDEMR